MHDENTTIAGSKSSEEESVSHKIDTTPTLPLGWTRIKRRRSSENKEDNDEECCEDPSCRRKHRAPLTLSTIDDEEKAPHMRSFRGTAVFCLHEANPEWFQGYFFQGATSWGVLCEQQEVDDCLQCADGGYRVLKSTLFTFSEGIGLPEKITIPDIEWTGGDMMRLLQAEGQMHFEPKQLYTSEKAAPLTKSLFKSLLRRLSFEGDSVADQNVLDIVPDVAIVLGEMKVVVPNRGDK